jgi:hypothetical protein
MHLKTYAVVVKYSKGPEYITTFSIPRSSELYPERDFWSENKPSGNPVKDEQISLALSPAN